MTSSGDGGHNPTGGRAWLFVTAAGWALIGAWALADGQTALGSAQLVLALVTLAAGLSSRVASVVEAPVLRRKSGRAAARRDIRR